MHQTYPMLLKLHLEKNRHIPCFPHFLNLVTEEGIELRKEVSELVSKLKTLVTWFKHSGIASDEYRNHTK